MKSQYTLPLSVSPAELPVVGGKGASLARLIQAGFNVPGGFHVTTAAYRRFVDQNALQHEIVDVLQAVDPGQPATLEAAAAQVAALFAAGYVPDDVAADIESAYSALAAGATVFPVAVRSSATAEDLPDASFAGQQETYLNVHGVEAVLDAVKRCWASLWTARAIGYRIRQGIDHDTVSLAVVVQMMVPADAAGILFTVNPLNGQRDQVLISASWGLGAAIVGGAVTPDTLAMEKATGRVIDLQVSDKQTMTVCTSEGTTEQPVPENLRREPVLSDGQVAELVRLGAAIEQHYGMPMDIEWALAADVFSILQARPITALPPEDRLSEPGAAPPTDWTVPDAKAMCMRNSIVELLPDPLSPLFATLGVRAINAGTVQLFGEIVGADAVPDEMFVTINAYAYYQIKMTFRFWASALLRVWSFLPRFFEGEARWRGEAVPRYRSVVERWQARRMEDVAAAEVLEGVYQLTSEAVNIYLVYQSGVVGLATVSELLFTSFYEKLIRRGDDPAALIFLLGGESMAIRAEKSLYDVAMWCREHPEMAGYVAGTQSNRLAADLARDEPPAGGLAADEWREWQRRFRAHLLAHGHVIYDLDFAKPVSADDPAPLLETLKLYLGEQILNPYERQAEQIARRNAASQAVSGRLKGLRLKWFRKLLGWAQKYGPMREDALSDIGLGYPLLRQMLREFGARLTRAGILGRADDIYWLTEAEATAAASALDHGGEALDPMIDVIRHRQAVWRAAKSITPPVTLPERQFMSRLMDRVGPVRAQQTSDTIKGVGASPGRVTVPACVLRGPEDFDRMRPGAALVAAITTPAWTPLFAMAAAIVTDVGGPLSHGSIVAREYGIPAVLGTGVATKRIRNGQLIAVDGEAGTVTLLDAPE